MEKNYNISRPQLMLPEYGRHIQDMVRELCQIEDREARNLRAKALIAILANIQSQSADTPDFERKLWDHLYIMSNFQLDVDSPYPAPGVQDIMPPPNKLDYPQSYIDQKHYGKNVRNTIKALQRITDQPTVDAVVYNLARYMRTKSYEFNQDHPDNVVIIRDLKNMADGTLEVDEEAIATMKSEYTMNPMGYSKKNNGQKKGGKMVKRNGNGNK